MPRDDQVTRQWHALQRLEASKRGLTLDELLAALPSDLAKHPRTLRRDLEALEAAHFPLLSERVDGHVRWRLLDGFRNVPALGLSPTELMALTFTRHLLLPLEGTEIGAGLRAPKGYGAYSAARDGVSPATGTILLDWVGTAQALPRASTHDRWLDESDHTRPHRPDALLLGLTQRHDATRGRSVPSSLRGWRALSHRLLPLAKRRADVRDRAHQVADTDGPSLSDAAALRSGGLR
jgi:hypothetical protein